MHTVPKSILRSLDDDCCLDALYNRGRKEAVYHARKYQKEERKRKKAARKRAERNRASAD